MINRDDTTATTSIADAIAQSTDTDFVPVTFEHYEHVKGPFFHGTKIRFEAGDELVPGHPSNYHEGRTSNHVYFAALIEPAVWAAELATAFSQSEEQGRVYVVEPTGPLEDDPNVTNKKFAGNVTRSYRTRHPMRTPTSCIPGKPTAPKHCRRCSTTSLTSASKDSTSSRTSRTETGQRTLCSSHASSRPARNRRSAAGSPPRRAPPVPLRSAR